MDKAVRVQIRGGPALQLVEPAAHSAWRKGDLILLTALTLLSLFLRITWAVTRNVVIENEGAEYARIAVNLAAGYGYTGLRAGPELVFPPVYPMLIRVGLLFTHSAAASARGVSIAAGTLLVPLVFLIVSTVYEKRPAWIAAVITGLHPFLIGFSASTYADCLYTTLLAGIIYFAILLLRVPLIHRFIALGAFLGLAYLTKPEALGQITILMVLILVVGACQHRLIHAIWDVAIILISWSILASPYVVYLARHTHHLRLEGKSELNYVLISRINAGMDQYRASYELNDTGQVEGPLLLPQLFIGKSSYPHTLADVSRFFFLAGSRNAHDLYDAFAPYVWLPVMILCLLGIFGSAWSQERVVIEMFLLSMFTLACVPLLIAPLLSLRYMLPVVPFLICWTAKGIDELGDWVHQTVNNLLPATRPGSYLRIATVMLLSLVILIIGAKNARHLSELKEPTATFRYLRDAGLALASRASGKVIVDEGTVVPFYAGATMMAMPYAQVPVILRYFQQHRPDFIIINQLKKQDALAEALKKDPHAHLLPLNLSSPLTIYEWKAYLPN